MESGDAFSRQNKPTVYLGADLHATEIEQRMQMLTVHQPLDLVKCHQLWQAEQAGRLLGLVTLSHQQRLLQLVHPDQRVLYVLIQLVNSLQIVDHSLLVIVVPDRVKELATAQRCIFALF